jgi:hypothetical protein
MALRGLAVATCSFVFALSVGCGGSRAYDTSSRTFPCGRAGFGEQCVARAVNTRATRIRACYEAELARAPTLSGQITIELTVEEDGETTGVHASDDTLGSPAVRECVISALDEMRFSPGSSGGPTTHHYPFIFEPRG